MKLPPSLRGILAAVSAAAGAGAFWVEDHRRLFGAAGPVIAALMVVFFVSGLGAFLLHLQQRDRRVAHAPRPSPAPVPVSPELEGTVYGLVPGRVYRVVEPFADHYANQFQPGERLRFRERHFLPYHGGHTLVFEERSIYLQETQNAEILHDFRRFVTADNGESATG
jgi:hypothetical protein